MSSFSASSKVRPLQLDILFLGPSSFHLMVGRSADKSISYTSLPVLLNLFPALFIIFLPVVHIKFQMLKKQYSVVKQNTQNTQCFGR